QQEPGCQRERSAEPKSIAGTACFSLLGDAGTSSHERPNTRRQECDDRSLDPGSATLIVDSKPDDRQPEGREREREEERVLEDGVGEMTQIAENTEGAEDDEDAAVQQYRDQHQHDVDQT